MTNETTQNTTTVTDAPKFEQMPQLLSAPEPESTAAKVAKRIVLILVVVAIRLVVHAMFR
jgi:hypothetical protein